MAMMTMMMEAQVEGGCRLYLELGVRGVVERRGYRACRGGVGYRRGDMCEFWPLEQMEWLGFECREGVTLWSGPWVRVREICCGGNDGELGMGTGKIGSGGAIPWICRWLGS